MAYYTIKNFMAPIPAGFATSFVLRVTPGDFNGDGKLDFVLTQALYPLENRAVPIQVMIGDGTGAFTDQTGALFGASIPQAVFPRTVAVGDFNRDGRPDLYIADTGYDAVPFPGAPNSLFLSSGATGLVNATDRLPGGNDYTHSVATADIDGDGDLDIYVGNTANPAPYFLINDGTGHFAVAKDRLPTAVGGPGNNIYTTETFFDANGDGALDLYLGPARQNGVSGLLINDGTGHFTAVGAPPLPAAWVPGSDAVDAQAIDLNGDGRQDLLVFYTIGSDGAKGYMQALINAGGNVFVDETSQRIPASFQGISVANGFNLADINGDGWKDILLASGTTTPLALNDGSGHFVLMPAGVVPGNAGDNYGVGDVNGDGHLDLISAWGRGNGLESMSAYLWKDPTTTQVATAGADGLMGDSRSATIGGGGGDDTIVGGSGQDNLSGDDGNDAVYGGAGADTVAGGLGADTLGGGPGNDKIDGGAGVDVAVYGAAAASYSLVFQQGAWVVTDLRAGAPDGTDTLTTVERLNFTDKVVDLTATDHATDVAAAAVLRSSQLFGPSVLVANGLATAASVVSQMVQAAQATTSVATMAYEFFTGKAPSSGGMDYLVSPTGPNANNLNAAYYQSFSLENRYINFAVNLGKVGEGNAAFTAKYGALSLFEATRTAYATIFGEAPSDTKLHAILDPTTVLNGVTYSRSDYFAYYGLDGANGIGTKAAMVGYLLAEAEKADLGVYAKSNDAFLTDVALHNAPFGVDLVGVYSQPGFVFHPG